MPTTHAATQTKMQSQFYFYTLDPNKSFTILEPVVAEKLSPCTPSPCGANAECQERNGAGACKCLPEYIGNPYEGCRPECSSNSDCAHNKACVLNKCTDPCPGTCGTNAECTVYNHAPSCTCRQGYTGDPFRYCSLVPEPGNYWRKINYLIANTNI